MRVKFSIDLHRSRAYLDIQIEWKKPSKAATHPSTFSLFWSLPFQATALASVNPLSNPFTGLLSWEGQLRRGIPEWGLARFLALSTHTCLVNCHHMTATTHKCEWHFPMGRCIFEKWMYQIRLYCAWEGNWPDYLTTSGKHEFKIDCFSYCLL